jgi:lipopolysaccharide transport system ATP-binding protein
MKPIITVKNISKKYTIMHQRAGYVTLRDSIANIFKHGPRSSKSKEVFWALKDINFTVNKGEVVGIIGQVNQHCSKFCHKSLPQLLVK